MDPKNTDKVFYKYPEFDPYDSPDHSSSLRNPSLIRQMINAGRRKQLSTDKGDIANINDYDKEFQRWSDFHGNIYNDYEITPQMLKAIARKESTFDKNSVSNYGAKGLMQVMPESFDTLEKDYGLKYGDDKKLFNDNPSKFDPNANIRGGTQWLYHKKQEEVKDLIEKGNTPESRIWRLLKAYHGWNGEGENYANEVFAETSDYARGLTQITDPILPELQSATGIPYTQEEMMDPEKNIQAGAYWLADGADAYHNDIIDMLETKYKDRYKKDPDLYWMGAIKGYKGWNDEGEKQARGVYNVYKQLKKNGTFPDYIDYNFK